jgi:hypothetical protein
MECLWKLLKPVTLQPNSSCQLQSFVNLFLDCNPTPPKRVNVQKPLPFSLTQPVTSLPFLYHKFYIYISCRWRFVIPVPWTLFYSNKTFDLCRWNFSKIKLLPGATNQTRPVKNIFEGWTWWFGTIQWTIQNC